MDNDIVLEPIERRVLGTLIEKCLTTPDYYPMTAKALVAGCNQKNNREPVSAWTDDDVQGGLASLQLKRMVMAVRPDGGHAIRWRHELDRKWAIQGRELAVLGELLLRGPQTEGELRARASRMGAFPEIETLHEMLELLRARTPPLAMRLSPEGAIRGGRKRERLASARRGSRGAARAGRAVPQCRTRREVSCGGHRGRIGDACGQSRRLGYTVATCRVPFSRSSMISSSRRASPSRPNMSARRCVAWAR